MTINALNEIRKKYNTFKQIFKNLKKSSNANISKEVIETEDVIEDLFIVEIFGFLERFLRNNVENCINQNKCFISNNIIKSHLEYMKIDNILDSLPLEKESIGYLKQIKSYRDWVAHGKNQNKPPHIQKVDFDKYFTLVEDIIHIVLSKNR